MAEIYHTADTIYAHSCYPRHKVFLHALVIPTSFLFARHLPSAKCFLGVQPKKPTHRCKESLSSIRSRRSNQQETGAPSILPARAGVTTMPSARIGRKADKVFKFLSTVNIFGNKPIKLDCCSHNWGLTRQYITVGLIWFNSQRNTIGLMDHRQLPNYEMP